ncbi:MAG: hypothetical protein IKX59_06140 [Bacteroidales bacterium]|nr:hypothetical protein [Bacteroidales bacterium]
MKKTLYLAVTILGFLTFGSLTSCQDEDFGVSTAVLQERAFEQGFINEFGKPSPDQSWDFYAQKMQSLRDGIGMTRATQAIGTPEATTQPLGEEYYENIVSSLKWVLEDEHNNSAVGQNSYSLTSTGDFNIYAVLYQGWYEQETGHNLDFGIVKDDGTRISLFGPINYRNYYKLDDNGNRVRCSEGDPINPGCNINANNDTVQVPGFAWHIPSEVGDQFYFYMRLTVGNYTYTYYSNSSTYYRSNSTRTLQDRYNVNPAGPSVLVYSTEVNTQAQGDNKQIMILGFEDGWSDNNADADYNDIVIVLEGNLPEPASKRFFCEDKKSFDWDYNDVVFDVSNYGVVLRAVGGTLPVFLRIQDKNDNSPQLIGMKNTDNSDTNVPSSNGSTYYELHELMRSQQYQTDYKKDNGSWVRNEHKNAQLTYEKDGKTYYRPIDVGVAPQGLWLDPVQICTWLNAERLTDTEVQNFANPLAQNKIGKVELVVLPEYPENGEYDLAAIRTATAHTDAGSDSNDSREKIKVIEVADMGEIPAIWSAPVSTKWMLESQKITLGYKNFYSGDSWWETETNESKMYKFLGDGDDTYTP